MDVMKALNHLQRVAISPGLLFCIFPLLAVVFRRRTAPSTFPVPSRRETGALGLAKKFFPRRSFQPHKKNWLSELSHSLFLYLCVPPLISTNFLRLRVEKTWNSIERFLSVHFISGFTFITPVRTIYFLRVFVTINLRKVHLTMV